MKNQVVVISNMDDNTYFFSKDHCQNGLGNNFVPCTHYLPSQVTPRENIPDGIVKDVKDLVAVFYYDATEIPNPDVNMQPVFKVADSV